MAIRTPRSAISTSWSTASLPSRSSDSVSSSVSRSAARPLSASAERTMPGSDSRASWRAETLTDRRRSPRAGRSDHWAACAQATRQHVRADRLDRAGALGHGDELERGDPAETRMVPAHERLDAVASAALQVDLRLVVHDDLAALDGVGEVLLECAQARDPLVLGRVEMLDAVL